MLRVHPSKLNIIQRSLRTHQIVHDISTLAANVVVRDARGEPARDKRGNLIEDGINRKTASNFVNGKPVRPGIFKACCEALELDWRDLVDADESLTETCVVSPVPKPVTGSETRRKTSQRLGPPYTERPDVENRCFETLTQPGAMLRLKAPRKMGKTALIQRRIQPWSQANELKLASVDFFAIESEVLENSNLFLQWFCQEVSNALDVDERVTDYWDEDLSPSSNCREYFSECVLESNSGLILCLDHIERIFNHSVSSNFFGMLRAWHSRAQSQTRWMPLRMVLAYSWQDLAIQGEQSPFNIGNFVRLPELDLPQIKVLRQQYEVELDADRLQRLRDFVGGNPGHIALLLSEARGKPPEDFDTLLEQSATAAGVLSRHCCELWQVLVENPDMASAFVRVLDAPEPVAIENPMIVDRLLGLGLIRLDKEGASVRCELYQEYFKQHPLK